MATARFAELIDVLLAAPKEMGGEPVWREVGSRGEHRIVMPLLFAGGGSSGAEIELNAYPNIRDLRFRIMLRLSKCIWRLDYVDDEQHVNPIERPVGVLIGPFSEPHYHSWADNRRYCTGNSLPDRLPIARIVPVNIRQFDAALRWFCGETHIAQPPVGLIQLPPRSRLL